MTTRATEAKGNGAFEVVRVARLPPITRLCVTRSTPTLWLSPNRRLDRSSTTDARGFGPRAGMPSGLSTAR